MQSLLLETQHNVWESTQRNSLRLKLGRDTHPERKGVGVLSTEEELSKSETRQRYTPGEECGRPEGGAQ